MAAVLNVISTKLFTVPTNLVPPTLPVNAVNPTQLGSYFKMFGGAFTSANITTKVNPDSLFIQEVHFQYTVRVIPTAPPGFIGVVSAPSITGLQSTFVDSNDNTSSLNQVGQHSFQIPNTGTAFFTRTIKALIININTIPGSFRYNIAQTPSTNLYHTYISTNGNNGLENKITVTNPVPFPIGTLVTATTGSGATGTVVAVTGNVLSINNMSNGVFAAGDILNLGPETVTVFDSAIQLIPASATMIVGGNSPSISNPS